MGLWHEKYAFKKGKTPPAHKLGCGCFRCSKTGIKFSQKGKKMSDEQKQAISNGLKGHRPFKITNPNAKEIRRVKELFYMKRRRSRKMNAKGTHSLQEWELLKEYFIYMCLCCKKQEPEITLSEDHIIPLSKGGSDLIENIQPLCRNCNSQKHTQSISYLPSNFIFNLQGERGVI